MKLRNSFVSNSSSSSYIIGIINDSNEPCPHCGRQDPSLINMLKRTNTDEWSANNTQIYQNKEDLLEEYREEIETLQREIKRLETLPDDMPDPDTTWREISVKEVKEQKYKYIEEKLEFIRDINGVEGEVYYISVDYNDQIVYDLIAELEKRGKINIIRDWS